MSFGKKWAQNNFVAVFMGLPNLAINLGVQALLDVGFHWSGWLAPLAYLIGTAASIQYSVLFSMLSKSNFTVLGHRWNWSNKETAH